MTPSISTPIGSGGFLPAFPRQRRARAAMWVALGLAAFIAVAAAAVLSAVAWMLALSD